MRVLKSAFVVAFGLFVATPAFATFHLMQIEQVIVGVNGDPTAQAVQLRMRANFENNISPARLRVLNDAGAVPVTLIDFAAGVPTQGAGRRILIATPTFQTVPPITPDYVMAQIPASYFAAGSLIYEQDPPGPIVLWRLSWGGAGYTGLTTGSTTNDVDGQFGVFAGPLPSTGNGQALLFNGTGTAPSTTNSADYSLTAAGPGATFTNNANATGSVPIPVPAEHATWGRVKDSYR